ncbi:hypothetical protein LCGC14_3161230 [marine sediment metagenome]|uniref:Uncharacterized protein n=1 Tax=marine sediment metagenome TaxID=412755 RepID=A0A0F8XXW8_9ZZZZ
MAVESEQVALILQLIILALVLYLLVTHNTKSNEEMSHLPIDANNMDDMDFSRQHITMPEEYP